jgi:hypothetical protein
MFGNMLDVPRVPAELISDRLLWLIPISLANALTVNALASIRWRTTPAGDECDVSTLSFTARSN